MTSAKPLQKLEHILLCCAKASDELQHNRALRWEEKRLDIEGFLTPLLATPCTAAPLRGEFLDDRACFLLEILASKGPKAPCSAGYFTYFADGRTSNCVLVDSEVIDESSHKRQKQLRRFDELINRINYTCQEHGTRYTVSLYREFVDQRFFCCGSKLLEGLRGCEEFAFSLLFAWIESLELGQIFFIPRYFHNVLVAVHSERNIRRIRFDEVIGVREIVGGTQDYPVRRRLLPSKGDLFDLTCTCPVHHEQYGISFFDVDDYHASGLARYDRSHPRTHDEMLEWASMSGYDSQESSKDTIREE
ncbi:hypothetical protein ACLMJK_000939 [Lecanora helva]